MASAKDIKMDLRCAEYRYYLKYKNKKYMVTIWVENDILYDFDVECHSNLLIPSKKIAQALVKKVVRHIWKNVRKLSISPELTKPVEA